MKTHKSPRKPGMHSIHDPKGSSARTLHAHNSVSTRTILIIAGSVVGFLILMYLLMAG